MSLIKLSVKLIADKAPTPKVEAIKSKGVDPIFVSRPYARLPYPAVVKVDR